MIFVHCMKTGDLIELRQKISGEGNAWVVESSCVKKEAGTSSNK